MSDSLPLEVAVERLGSADVIRLAGELDMANVDGLERAVASTAAPHVVLDLEALTYLDSAGIRAIDRTYHRLVEGHRTLVVVASARSRAGWTFRVAGFGAGLVTETLDAALASGPPSAAG